MNKKFTFAASAAVALACVSVTPAQARAERCAVATRPMVEAQFNRFNAALATGNPGTVTALFGPGAALLPTLSNVPRTDPAGIRDYFVEFLKKKPIGRVDSSTVRIGCNMASRVGTWTVSLADPNTGARSDVKARFSFVYRYAGGRWMIDHLHSSVMPEGQH